MKLANSLSPGNFAWLWVIKVVNATVNILCCEQSVDSVLKATTNIFRLIESETHIKLFEVSPNQQDFLLFQNRSLVKHQKL